MPDPLVTPPAEIRRVDEAARAKFKKAFLRLREENKQLAEGQRQLRLQQKPTKGAIRKSRHVAAQITALLNVSRQVRGLASVYIPKVKCRLCGVVKVLPAMPVHAPPRDCMTTFENWFNEYLGWFK